MVNLRKFKMQFNCKPKFLTGVGLVTCLALLISVDYAMATDTRLNKIEDVAESYHNALLSKDRESALAVLSSDVIIIEGGHVQTREEYISHHLDADIDFTSNVTSRRKVIRTFVDGNVGWIISSTTVTGRYKGREINSTGAELMVLRQQNEMWNIVAIHWSSHSN